ncbi:MAG: hypothetical protein DDT34_01993 [Firmicutes bacterium]|nr:hypothetical protein [Bacillota bacterium]
MRIDRLRQRLRITEVAVEINLDKKQGQVLEVLPNYRLLAPQGPLGIHGQRVANDVLVEGKQLILADAWQRNRDLIDQRMMEAVDVVLVQPFLTVFIELKSVLESLEQRHAPAIDAIAAVGAFQAEQTEQPLVKYQCLIELDGGSSSGARGCPVSGW